MKQLILLSALVLILTGSSITRSEEADVQLPTVFTLPAIDIGYGIATLCGLLDSDGGQACEYRFRYKRATGTYSYTSWDRSVTAGLLFRKNLSGLSFSAIYYFNAQARNSAGESEWGNEQSFTAPTMPSAGDFQLVEGFSSIAGSSNQGNYITYRGQYTLSYWEYASWLRNYVESLLSGCLIWKTL